MTPAEKILFDRIADKSDQYVAERKANGKLLEAMRALRDDLLLRGDLMNERGPDGRIVVDVSQTVWNNFCAAIGDRA